MWWFAILYFVNAVAPHHTLIYNENFRLVVGGMPINILDGLILFAGVMSVWPRTAWPVPQVHPAWRWGLTFLGVAFVVGVAQSFLFFPDLPDKFRLPIIRNFVLAPICLFMGYRCFTRPSQAKAAFWIVFVGSIGSAVASILTQGQAASALAETSRATGGLDNLRWSALDVSGEAGLLAAGVILFSMVSGIRLFGLMLRGISLLICAAGMFLIPHRSAWVMDGLTLAYAGLVLWPLNMGRKIAMNVATFGGLLLAGVVLMLVVQSATQRDFTTWVQDRLESLLPGERASNRETKAWDTRLPGMLKELELSMGNPILGRGFAVQEWDMILNGRGGDYRHTPWVSTFCETGLPGLAGFGITIFGLAIVGTRLARQCPDKWFALLGAIGAAWGVVCIEAGFMTLHWNSPRSAITLGLLAGLIFRARDLSSTMAAQQLPLSSYANRGYETNPA